MLLDLRLPGIDGWEVLRRLRARTEPAPPVVLYTAHDGQAVRAQAAELGCSAVLVKPCSIRDLGQALDRAASLDSRL